MTIVDLDKLVEEEPKRLLFKGREYAIRPITYRQMIELSKLEKQIEDEIEDTEKILNLQASYVEMVVPEMTYDLLMEATTKQVRAIQEAIREVLAGVEVNAEVDYYRKKYKDEYRKNFERVGEKIE